MVNLTSFYGRGDAPDDHDFFVLINAFLPHDLKLSALYLQESKNETRQYHWCA